MGFLILWNMKLVCSKMAYFCIIILFFFIFVELKGNTFNACMYYFCMTDDSDNILEWCGGERWNIDKVFNY